MIFPLCSFGCLEVAAGWNIFQLNWKFPYHFYYFEWQKWQLEFEWSSFKLVLKLIKSCWICLYPLFAPGIKFCFNSEKEAVANLPYILIPGYSIFGGLVFSENVRRIVFTISAVALVLLFTAQAKTTSGLASERKDRFRQLYLHVWVAWIYH